MDGAEFGLPAGLGQRAGQRDGVHGSVRADEEAGAGDGAEGGGDLEFWVVVAAGLFEGAGPAVIEDVFAVTVALCVHGGAGEQAFGGITQGGVAGEPAGAGGGGAAVLHGGEEGVADEGIVRSGAGVPVGGVNFVDGAVEAQSERGGVIRH